MSTNKRSFVLLLTGISCCLLPFAGCGDSAKFPSDSRQPLADNTSQSGYPQWATCTIGLRTIQAYSDESLVRAEQIKNQIQAQTRWTDLHIIQSDRVIKVCRGYFRTFSDKDAQRMLQQVRSYRDPQRQQSFGQAFFADLPRDQSNPIIAGPPEWDLRRAPGNASLCIGFFINDELCKDRLAAAVKKVKNLRNKGIKAWYYHGEFRSGVYVGHFNADRQWVTIGKTNSGQPITRIKLVTHDPNFTVLKKKFPTYQRNGEVQGRWVGKRRLYDASVLVAIPKFGEKVPDVDVGLH